ncbi:MAG: flagellin N-terminal helical domain-containing protein [Planctomycetota bacterium]|jgi:flagellin
MGLRIGTNMGALSALRSLRLTGARELRVSERLATGLRINRASDDPSGLILLQRFSAELSAIQQATENTQNATNMVNVADAALGQVSDRIIDLRGNVIAALNTGVIGDDAQRALQNSIDATLSSIDRMGATTRFSDRGLLNGELGFQITNADPELTSIDVQGGNFPGGFPFDVTVDVAAAATRAEAGGTLAATQSADVRIRVTGPRGTEDFEFAAGTTRQQMVDAINARSEVTGVEATAAGAVRTEEFGSNQTLNIQELEGDLEGVAEGLTRGTDIVATVNGADASGRGNVVTATGGIEGEFTVQQETAGTFTFQIAGGGARFQLGTMPGGADQFQMGIGAVSTATLGESSGVGNLADLRTGGPASLTNDPGRALQILDAASREVGALRGRLGAVAARVFEPNVRALDVAFENLSAARSRIGDADMAEEIANSIRERLLRQTGLSALRESILRPDTVLRLLS